MGKWIFQETAPVAATIPGRRIGPASPEAGTVGEQLTVPLGQALVSGIGASAAVGICAWALWGAPFSVFWPFTAVAFALVFVASWAVFVSDARGLLRVAETWDTPTETPAAKPQDRIVLVRAGDSGAEADVELPRGKTEAEGPGDFERFMASALVSTSLADLERRWPRPYIQNVRDQLIEAGLASWAGKGRNAGWQLTPRGRAVAERCKSTLGRPSK